MHELSVQNVSPKGEKWTQSDVNKGDSVLGVFTAPFRAQMIYYWAPLSGSSCQHVQGQWEGERNN